MVGRAKPRFSPSKCCAYSTCSSDVAALRASSHRVGLDFRVLLVRLASYWLMLPPWASTSQARPKADRVICSTWCAALEPQKRMVHTLLHLSCPLSRVQSFSESACLRPPALTVCSRTSSWSTQASSGGLPWGFAALRRLQTEEATYTGFSRSGCATPSGFLNLLTL
jgi:hypothetical protein